MPKSGICLHLFAAAAALGLASPAAAQSPIAVFGTGLRPNGGGLAPLGSADPHWALVTTGGQAAAYVGSSIPDNWLPNGPSSRWIGPTPNLNQDAANGTYRYVTTFDLTGQNSSTASLSIRVAVDNRAEVWLNGSFTGVSEQGFGSFGDVSVIAAGFTGGLNTLELRVMNGGTVDFNPTGVRAEVSGTVSPVPEPGCLLLLVGVAGLAARAGTIFRPGR